MFHIEKNFITEEERLAVKKTVLDFEKYWDHYENITPNGANVYSVLGNGLYLMEAKQETVADINLVTRQLLIDNLNWLYQKICDYVANMTFRNTELHPFLTVPGFHIGCQPGSYRVNRFHNDMSILTYDREGNMDTNYSVLIPIEMPSTGACLHYLDAGEEKKLPYELGAFTQWKATLDHKIGDFELKPGEYRITLQCHYYHNVNDNTNYVYF